MDVGRRRRVTRGSEGSEVAEILAFPVVEITSDAAALHDLAVGLRRLGQAIVDFWASPVAVAFVRMVMSEGARFPDLPHNFFEAGKATAMRALIGDLVALEQAGRNEPIAMGRDSIEPILSQSPHSSEAWYANRPSRNAPCRCSTSGAITGAANLGPVLFVFAGPL
jgi:hypothetical protein